MIVLLPTIIFLSLSIIILWKAKNNRTLKYLILGYIFLVTPILSYSTYYLGLSSANMCFSSLIYSINKSIKSGQNFERLHTTIEALKINEYEYTCPDAYEKFNEKP